MSEYIWKYLMQILHPNAYTTTVGMGQMWRLQRYLKYFLYLLYSVYTVFSRYFILQF